MACYPYAFLCLNPILPVITCSASFDSNIHIGCHHTHHLISFWHDSLRARDEDARPYKKSSYNGKGGSVVSRNIHHCIGEEYWIPIWEIHTANVHNQTTFGSSNRTLLSLRNCTLYRGPFGYNSHPFYYDIL